MADKKQQQPQPQPTATKKRVKEEEKSESGSESGSSTSGSSESQPSQESAKAKKAVGFTIPESERPSRMLVTDSPMTTFTGTREWYAQREFPPVDKQHARLTKTAYTNFGYDYACISRMSMAAADVARRKEAVGRVQAGGTPANLQVQEYMRLLHDQGKIHLHIDQWAHKKTHEIRIASDWGVQEHLDANLDIEKQDPFAYQHVRLALTLRETRAAFGVPTKGYTSKGASARPAPEDVTNSEYTEKTLGLGENKGMRGKRFLPDSLYYEVVNYEKSEKADGDGDAKGPAKNPAAKLLLAGDGSLRSQLEAQAVALGVTPQVRFLGRRDDIPQMLAASDVFVLASLWEGNPLSVMEALAAGLPAVVTAVGGVPELVANEIEGLVVPAGDPLAFSAAMVRVASNPTMRRAMGIAATKRAVTEFDDRNMVEAYESLYDELLPGSLESRARVLAVDKRSAA